MSDPVMLRGQPLRVKRKAFTVPRTGLRVCRQVRDGYIEWLFTRSLPPNPPDWEVGVVVQRMRALSIRELNGVKSPLGRFLRTALLLERIELNESVMRFGYPDDRILPKSLRPKLRGARKVLEVKL